MLTLMLVLSLSYQTKPVPPPEGVKVARDRVLIQTKAGYIAIALYPEIAPKHTVQIMKLVKEGVYDGICIPRIDHRFVMQFSGAENDKIPPLTPAQLAHIAPIPGEFSKLKHVRGTVSMARDNDPNSARTSFSIILQSAPHLDSEYTIFGHVEYGMDVVEELIKAPLNGTAPIDRLQVIKMHLVDGDELHADPPPAARVIFAAGLTSEAGNPSGERPMVSVQDRNVVFSIGITLMMLCVLIPMMMPSLKPKQAQTIQLISVLIGGFLLVAVLQPVSIALFQTKETYNTGHLIAIILFFGLLGIFRLMSSFESAA
jgi:cyclophilin family peptidyl-prolyl cis-trans isomerase